jgi:hypothetical protein
MIRLWTVAFLAVVAACLAPAGTVCAGGKPHPHLHQALYELREARGELNAAPHDFGGHRKAAVGAVDAAIRELEQALKFSGDKRPFKGNPKAEVYRKYVSYPHIHHAMNELRETVSELRSAGHDYGGHREAAVRDTQAAIRQLELCLGQVRKK